MPHEAEKGKLFLHLLTRQDYPSWFIESEKEADKPFANPRANLSALLKSTLEPSPSSAKMPCSASFSIPSTQRRRLECQSIPVPEECTACFAHPASLALSLSFSRSPMLAWHAWSFHGIDFLSVRSALLTQLFIVGEGSLPTKLPLSAWPFGPRSKASSSSISGRITQVTVSKLQVPA